MNNLENKEITEEKLAHEQARELLLSIQTQSGAAIRPLGIFQFFYSYLQKFHKSRMNKIKARNIAEVYCALQNEFFITNGCKNPHEWFYMTESRWDKYGLGKKAIYNSVKFLNETLFIETTLRTHPYKPQNKVRYYKIDMPRLLQLVKYAEGKNPKIGNSHKEQETI